MVVSAFSWEFTLKQHSLVDAILGRGPGAENLDIAVAKDSLPYSDLAAARFLHNHFETLATYIPAEDMWYFWNGKIHEPLDKAGDGAVFARDMATMLHDTLRDALALVEKAYSEQRGPVTSGTGQRAKTKTPREQYVDEFKQQRAFRDKLGNHATSRGLVEWLKHEFMAENDIFLNDQRWFVVENGVFDLNEIKREVESLGHLDRLPVPRLHPHELGRRVARYFKAPWLPGAGRDRWTQFLESSVPDVETREYLQLLVGAAFLGHAKLKTIPNLSGPQDSGKSIFVNVLAELGSGGFGYSSTPDSAAIMEKEGTNTARDEIRGRRFVAITEPSTRDKLDATFVKKVTGGDQTHSRLLYKNEVHWKPQCIIFVASNDPVRFQSSDVQLLERVKLLDFPNRHWPAGEKPNNPYVMDLDLERALSEDENSGILAWIMIGMMKFIRAGYKATPPMAATINRETLRTAGSSSARWMHDMLENELLIRIEDRDRDGYKNGQWIERKDAWDCYRAWATYSNEKPLSKNLFLEDISKDHKTVRGTGGRSQHAEGLLPTIKWSEALTGDIPWQPFDKFIDSEAVSSKF